MFGTEIWPAAEYGRTMYTIRQRIGPLLMQMEKRNGLLKFPNLYSFVLCLSILSARLIFGLVMV